MLKRTSSISVIEKSNKVHAKGRHNLKRTRQALKIEASSEVEKIFSEIGKIKKE